MAFNLAALGAIPQGMQQYQQKQQQIQMAQLQLDQAKRQVAAEGAALQGLLQGYNPQQPQPGQPSQPMQQPPMMGAGGMQTGGGTQSSPMPPPVASAGALGPSGALGGPQAGGQPQPSPGPPNPFQQGLTIEQLAQRIKQRNPGVDNATVFEAVKQSWQLLNPESRMMLQYLLGQQRQQTAERGQDIGLQKERESTSQRADAAAARESTARAGQALSHADRLASLDIRSRTADAIDRRFAIREAGREQNAAAAGELKALMAERMTIRDELSQMNQMAPGDVDVSRQKQLIAQAKQTDDKIAGFLRDKSKNTAGLTVDDILKIERGEGGGAGAAPAPSTPAPPTPPAAATPPETPKPYTPGTTVPIKGAEEGPAGAPDPKTLKDGQTGTDAAGVKWIVKDGKWMKAGG